MSRWNCARWRMAGRIDTHGRGRAWVGAAAALMLAGFRQAAVDSPVYENEHGEVYLSASPGRCRDVELELSSALDSAARSDTTPGERACPGPERFVPGQDLVFEGLDRHGAILWFAIGRDATAAGSQYAHGAASPGNARSVSVAMPVNRMLSRIRWFSITPDLRFRQLGERRWRGK